MVLERFQSVISQLLQFVGTMSLPFCLLQISNFLCFSLLTFALIELQRIIRCGGAVDDDMANIIVAQLLYLDAIDPTKVCILSVLYILFIKRALEQTYTEEMRD